MTPHNLDDRSRGWPCWCCAGALMIVLDATVVNVASIQPNLGFSPSDLAW